MLTRAERIQIAATAHCDERSVAAAYNGAPTRSMTRARIAEAARKLKLPPFEEPNRAA